MIETTLRHCSICGTERETPVRPIDAMAEAPARVGEALRSATTGADGWPPGFVIAHLADTEIAFGWRIRQILSEDVPTLAAFDEMRWADALRYAERDSGTSLRAFEAARLLNVEILRQAGEGALGREYVQTEYGRRSLGDLLLHRADHDLQHLAQIQGRG